MNANAIIAIAQQHIGKGEMISSAELCLDDARRALKIGAFESAKSHGLKSIAYSVGKFHPDYILAGESK